MNEDATAPVSPTGKKRLRLAFLIVLIGVLIVAARIWNVGAGLEALRNWIAGLGPYGSLAYVLIYIAAVVVAVPGAAITVAGAALFGPLWGVVLVSIASTTGAALAFLISRYAARDFVFRRLSTNEKFLKLDRMTEKHGAIIVALTRLVPLFPFNLLNYGFGLTAIPFKTYLFWSWLCMLPGTILYVAGTDAVLGALSRGRFPGAAAAVLSAAVIVIIVLGRYARKRLREKDKKGFEQG
ncbi:MAG: TVP38/TMEM64 family protein [Smithellaceae bacterium]|nr:TVP38/TMEM64 family protein [Smithellaceae bacterium]